VLDAARLTLLDDGASIIVGTVGPDGMPHAGRGWGIDVLPDEGNGLQVRVLLDITDTTAIAHLSAGGAVAVTVGDVHTLRCVQLKGRAVSVEAASEHDRHRAAASTAAFFQKVHEVDNTPLALLERLTPVGHIACVVSVHDIFDQTPGPGAGAPVGGGST
jgi:hypothetical protein